MTRCSANPNADGTPTKSWIPNSVCVDAIRPDATLQPKTPPPTFPVEPSSGTVEHDQWEYDKELFDNGESPADGADNPPTLDYYGGDMAEYEAALAQYNADLAAFNAASHGYATIYDDNDAGSDANTALQSWLNVCIPPIPPSPGDPNCCFHVLMDDNALDFNDLGLDPVGTEAYTQDMAGKPGYPTCNEDHCPHNDRYILFNVSDDFLDQSTSPSGPDPNYAIHDVHHTGWYTSTSGKPFTQSGFDAVSFFEVVQHELGHLLGMHHPDELGSSCPNCYTANPSINSNSSLNPNGYWTVMMPAYPRDYSPIPGGLTDEDKCQFQKLYCNPCASGVGQGAIPEPGLTATLFPNPTSGRAELEYNVPVRALVNISIYDVLGHELRVVTSGFESEGSRTISLGGESLASGHYICRISIGDCRAGIDLVIQK